MPPTILVTGGTGTLGGHVLPLLHSEGHPARVLSRHSGGLGGFDDDEYIAVDLMSGAGLDDALQGVRTVLHLAGGPKGDDVSTRNLVEAAKREGSVEHLVLISVVGAEAVPIGYFTRKALAEQIVIESGLPYSVLRAAQFHDLTLKTVQGMAKAPVLLAPSGVRWQPVDSRDVAARLVELVLGEPSGRVPDHTGPKVYTLEELQRSYLAMVGKRRVRLPIHVPGKAGKAYRAGVNLSFDGLTGTGTWESFLTEHVGRRRIERTRPKRAEG